MAIFKFHTSCPNCGSSDANAIYDDGGSYCYSCGVPGGASKPSFRQETDEEEFVVLPPNLSTDFPQEVVNWIAPTTVTIEELYAHGYLFSHTTGQLVRPFYTGYVGFSHIDLGRGAIAYEARRILRDGRTQRCSKTMFKGGKQAICAYSYQGRPYSALQLSPSCAGLRAEGGSSQDSQAHLSESRLVIVEDSLSSIRVGRYTPSVPLFGSSCPKDKLVSLIKPFDEVVVWLDSNKLHAARSIAEQVTMLGKKSRVIFTELDPKYVDNIEELVAGVQTS